MYKNRKRYGNVGIWVLFPVRVILQYQSLSIFILVIMRVIFLILISFAYTSTLLVIFF